MRALAGAALVVALASATLAQNGPPDGVPDGLPGAVGRISYGPTHSPGAAICTGTLVAPDLVLTAGHCVRGAAAHPATILFSAGLQDGKALATARGRAVIAAQGQGLSADLALVRLDRRLPDTIAPLHLGAETGQRLTRFAYRRDSPDSPEREDLCLILVDDPPLLRVGCSAASGNSGAAVLSWGDGGWQVAGVTVARVTSGFGSIAVRVPADLGQVIDHASR